MILETKWCPVCRLTKPTGEFYQDKKRTSGIRSECKPCGNELRKSKRAFPGRNDVSPDEKSWLAACLKCGKKIMATVRWRHCENCFSMNSRLKDIS